jgi:hypothetical protein
MPCLLVVEAETAGGSVQEHESSADGCGWCNCLEEAVGLWFVESSVVAPDEEDEGHEG